MSDSDNLKSRPLQRILDDLKKGLLIGGPEVDEGLLCAYVADMLSDADRQLIKRRIATWKSWFDSWWEICTVESAFTDEIKEEALNSISGIAQASSGWLAADLRSTYLQGTSVARKVLFLATGLAACLAFRRSGKMRSDPIVGEDSTSRLEESIAEGTPLVFRDKERWVHMAFQGESIHIRAGKSPTEAFTQFRVELCHGQEVLKAFDAEDGVTTIHSQDLEETAMNTANTLVITSSEAKG